MRFMILAFALLASLTTVAGNELIDKLISEGNSSVQPCANFYRHVCPLMKVENKPRLRFRMDFPTEAETLAERWRIYPGLRAKHVAMLNHIVDINPYFKSRLLHLVDAGEDAVKFADKVFMQAATASQYLSKIENVYNFINGTKYFSSEKLIEFYNATQALNGQVLAEVKRVMQNADWTNKRYGNHTVREIISMFLESTEMSPIIKPDSHPFDFETLANGFYNLIGKMQSAHLAPEESFGDAKLDIYVSRAIIFSEYLSEQFEADPTFALFTFGSSWNAANIRAVDHALVPSVLPSIALIYKIFTSGLPTALRDAQYHWAIGHELMHSFIGHWDTVLAQNHGEAYKRCIEERAEDTCEDYQEETCKSGNDTYSEDGPDVEGARVAYSIYMDSFAQDSNKTASQEDRQLFFYAIAKENCDTYQGAQHSIVNGTVNPHSADYVRVNNVVRQMPEFAEAFGCKAEDQMVLPKESICVYFPPEQTA